MSARRTAIGERPKADHAVESWIRCGDSLTSAASITAVNVHTARLTIDVAPGLRGRIKVAAFRQGLTVADMLRALFEREFPEGEGST